MSRYFQNFQQYPPIFTVEEKKSNGFGVAGFVLSFVGFILLWVPVFIKYILILITVFVLLITISVNLLPAQSIRQEKIKQQQLQGQERKTEREKQKFINVMLPLFVLADSIMKNEYGDYAEVSIGEVILGDLNGDGVNDAIVNYNGSEGTLASAFRGNWVFVMEQENANVITANFGTGIYENDFCLFPYPVSVTKIENGIVYCTSCEYIFGDARCCPSINIELTYKLVNNKMVKLSEKRHSEKTEAEIANAIKQRDEFLEIYPDLRNVKYKDMSSVHKFLDVLTLQEDKLLKKK
jgi:hypothetical protein